MRHALLLAAVLLAGCGAAGVTNNGSEATTNLVTPALPGNLSPMAPANDMAPDGDTADGNATAGGAPGGGARGRSRSEMLADCTSEASAMLPGVDAGALCGCAVDRVIAGAQRNQAVRQCAAEQNVRLPGG